MYILGILIGLYLHISIVFLCITFLIISVIVYIFSKKIFYAISIFFIIIGNIYVYFIDVDYDNFFNTLPEEIEMKAVVMSDPEEKEYKNTYNIIIYEINGEKLDSNKKVIFNLKKSKESQTIPKIGDKIKVNGTIERPAKARNYKGFDYEIYLKSKRIYGSIETKSVEILSHDELNIIDKGINTIQNNIKNNMKQILGTDEAGLCTGILIGARDNISEEIEDNFKKSNLTHMLAVSGSHVTYIITVFASTLGKSNKKATKIFTIIFLVFFMALTGYTASVLRACIMGMLVLVASLTFRKSDTINNLCISAFIILLINPYTIIDLGFLLSYGGTIGIVLMSRPIGDFIKNKLLKKDAKILIDSKEMTISSYEENNMTKEEKNKDKKCYNTNINKEIIEKDKIVNKTIVDNEKNRILNKITTNQQCRSKNETYKKILKKIIEFTIDSFSITLSANLIIIPIMAYSFSTFSFTFWISNILAGPIMEVVTIFGFLIYFLSIIFFPIAKFLGVFLNILLEILLKIAEISSIIPGSSIYIKTPYLAECIIYYIVILLIFTRKSIISYIQNNNKMKQNEIAIKFARMYKKYKKLIKDRKRLFKYICIKITKNSYKILAVILICIFIYIPFYNNKETKIYFVDVGQGDCTVIKTIENKTILIDGGGSEFGNFDVGESILLPYLLDRRITMIDYIIISHFDSDHIGGLFYIMENLEVKNIIISKQRKESENLNKFKNIVKENNINVIIVKKGDYIKVDKYSYIEILFPTQQLIQENVLNNNSIVFKFNTIGLNMLFTGDIEEIAENELYEIYNNINKLKADILKVAHHGSKTSSTEKFLELVEPKIALIGVGADNNFGHPNSIVLDRLEQFTNLIYRTDLCGEISIIANEKKITVNTKNSY